MIKLRRDQGTRCWVHTSGLSFKCVTSAVRVRHRGVTSVNAVCVVLHGFLGVPGGIHPPYFKTGQRCSRTMHGPIADLGRKYQDEI